MVMLEGVRVLQHLQAFFCGSRNEYIGSFSSFLGVQHSLYAKVMGAILAIELAWSKNLTYIWLECDSSLLLSNI